MLGRTIFAIAALATIVMIQPRSADAAPYWPWCSQYGGDMGAAHACAFSSWEQCMQTVSGIGGWCYHNYYPEPVTRSAPPRRHARG